MKEQALCLLDNAIYYKAHFYAGDSSINFQYSKAYSTDHEIAENSALSFSVIFRGRPLRECTTNDIHVPLPQLDAT